ncbi:hypothetical protein LR48_Vigan10g068700 [Vigna angularis]|uniref:Uncharacterized protein n=1 Tax=Phaseolus angularis TaxID=3914 RepID=A0A0L9VIA2_PHAAN|nr:hypothetical protein LR48_Vigan10g068700 [Vigna angularis]
MEGSTEGRLEALKIMMEGMKVESAAVPRDLQEIMRMMRARAHINDGQSDGSQASANRNQRRREEDIGGRGREVFRDSRSSGGGESAARVHKHVGQRELLDQSLEGESQESFLGRFEGAVVVRFGEQNEGTIFERVAANKQSRTAEEYVPASNVRELPEPNRLGLQEANPRGLKEPNGRGLPKSKGRGRPEANVRGLPELYGRELSEPNGRGLKKLNVTGRPELNRLALQAANPRGLKEPNSRGLPEPNRRGRPKANSKQSLSNWPNGLTIRMKAEEGKVDGRINARERRMDFVKRWTSEQKKGLAVREAPAEERELFDALKDIKDHFLTAYNSEKR